MIDEKKLIEEMNKYARENFHLSDEFEWVLEGMIKALDIVERQPKVGEWIPVSERLPSKNGTYLCQIDCGIRELIGVLDFNTNLYKVSKFEFYEKKCAGFYDYDSEWGYCEVDDVIAWQPLPELYRKDVE